MKFIKTNNNSGFSLIELMVGVGLSAIATLACFTLINQSYSSYVSASNTSANIIETVGSAATLRQILSYSVNIINDNTQLKIPTQFSKDAGYVREFDLTDWDSTISGSGEIIPVFTGYVDQLKSSEFPTANEIVPSIRFLPITVFFQKPTVDKYGVIYMALGNSKSKTLQPSDAQFLIDQIVDFKIKDIEIPYKNTKRVSRFTMEFTRRNFKKVTENEYIWCPPQFMSKSVCSKIRSYFDTSEFININLRNNKLRDSTTQKKLVANTATPKYVGIPERYQTGVYFLRPKISWDTLKR